MTTDIVQYFLWVFSMVLAVFTVCMVIDHYLIKCNSIDDELICFLSAAFVFVVLGSGAAILSVMLDIYPENPPAIISPLYVITLSVFVGLMLGVALSKTDIPSGTVIRSICGIIGVFVIGIHIDKGINTIEHVNNTLAKHFEKSEFAELTIFEKAKICRHINTYTKVQFLTKSDVLINKFDKLHRITKEND